MRLILIIFIAIVFAASAQPKVVKLAELQKLIHTPSEKIQVINFWATWCGPCVKEMPLIEKIGQERSDIRDRSSLIRAQARIGQGVS